MKRLVLGLSIVVGAWMLTPTPEADARGWYRSSFRTWSSWTDYDKDCKTNGGAVPELDPGAAGGAMVLLLGGVAYLASRRREEVIA